MGRLTFLPVGSRAANSLKSIQPRADFFFFLNHIMWFLKVHRAILKPAITGGGRARGGGAVFNNRGIIYPVMALTTAQRPPGRDQSRSQQIRHTQQLSHTLFSTVRPYDALPLRDPWLGSFSQQPNQ